MIEFSEMRGPNKIFGSFCEINEPNILFGPLISENSIVKPPLIKRLKVWDSWKISYTWTGNLWLFHNIKHATLRILTSCTPSHDDVRF